MISTVNQVTGHYTLNIYSYGIYMEIISKKKKQVKIALGSSTVYFHCGSHTIHAQSCLTLAPAHCHQAPKENTVVEKACKKDKERHREKHKRNTASKMCRLSFAAIHLHTPHSALLHFKKHMYLRGKEMLGIYEILHEKFMFVFG